MEHPGDTAANPHPPHLAHHFHSAHQQFESGKLGMWVFLATEVLFFGGLFCAYAVYRSNHPEIFVYAHKYLNSTLGGINTIVLICSSLTMAWAVRCAQCDQQRGLVVLLALTLLFACGFLGIKYVEYEHKWKHGLLWGKHFQPTMEPGGSHEGSGAATRAAATAPTDPKPAATAPAAGVATTARSTIAPAAIGPAGLARYAPDAAGHEPAVDKPRNVQIFFGVYFAMTGLHAIHVIAGMVMLIWLLRRALRGHFSSAYFTPVDLGGLYWHLVDLIWIFLFPLLYLIH